jgi:transcriptional regulator with XRE-family HTH domain
MLDVKKIQSLREKAGMSQAEAARKAGLTGRQHWHDIESGRKASMTLTTLDKIAKALGVKAKELLK